MSNNGFEQLTLDRRLLDRLSERSIETPTEIQRRAIPHILDGDDLIARSNTGTGKTLAYLLPVLERLEPEVKQVQAIVLAPTQELAMQITAEAEDYGAVLGLSVLPLIGGASVRRQVEKLKNKPQLVIGTAGRLLELIRMKKLKMHDVRTIVIDEADHVLKQGDMNLAGEIVRAALRDRQLLLFSATMPDGIAAFARQWSDKFVEIGTERPTSAADTLEHHYHVVEARSKVDTLRRLVHAYKPDSAIVFVNDGERIDEIAAKLKHVGLSLEALHSGADKRERALVMNRFRQGRFPLLLATDMAARGLDLDGLTHVFHYDPAFDAGAYIHRAGRTGRMGSKGWSVSLVTPNERFIVNKFARELGIDIQLRTVKGGEILDGRETTKPDRDKRNSPGGSKPFRHHKRRPKR